MSSLDDGAGPELGEDDPTPIVCRACGGDWQRVEETTTGHRMIRCRWCVRGAQSLERLRAWQAHVAAHAPR